MNKAINIILLFSTIFIFSLTHAQDKSNYIATCVAFYNLENLFDTIVDPDTSKILNEDFTPEGKKSWNTRRYKDKLKNLSEVISKLGTEVNPDGPAVLGVSEVENEAVLEDLVATKKIEDRNYKIVHYESPDHRGIDVALLYQLKYFKVMSSVAVPMTEEDLDTREQLLVTGKLNGEKIHFIVAHWPSRYGGQKESNPARIAAAKLGKKIIDSLQDNDPQAKVVYMGDLNDDPKNESIKNYLQGKRKKRQVKEDDLYNPMYDLYKKGVGTLAYRDNWNLFDQILMTKPLLKESYDSYRHYKTVVYNKNYLQQQKGKYEGYPWRSYAGGSYIGGYSDHFPVYVFLVKETGATTSKK